MKVLLQYHRGGQRHLRIITVTPAKTGSLWKSLANYTADMLEAQLTAFNVIDN